MRLQVLTITLGLVLSMPGAARSEAGDVVSDRHAATVVPFYEVGGQKVSADLSDRLTRQVVRTLKQDGGIARVGVGYPRDRVDMRLRVRPYRVRIGAVCWVAVEIGRGQNPDMVGTSSPPGGCGPEATAKALRSLLPRIVRLVKEGPETKRATAPRVSVSRLRSACERILPTIELFALTDLLAVRLSGRVRMVPHRWTIPPMRLHRGPREITSARPVNELTPAERRRGDIRRSVSQATAVGVSLLVAPGFAPQGDRCVLSAGIIPTDGGKTTALIQADPISSTKELPVAFDQLAQKLEAALRKHQ